MENRLAELRKQMGLTQQQLGNLAQVSRQTINAIESGRFNPSVELAFRLSHIFKKPIEEIFIYHGGSGDEI